MTRPGVCRRRWLPCGGTLRATGLQAHALVDELETQAGMAVHAYLHRKEGQAWNAEYWYKRSGRQFHREQLEDEWAALVEGL
jgi:hypothetical protein